MAKALKTKEDREQTALITTLKLKYKGLIVRQSMDGIPLQPALAVKLWRNHVLLKSYPDISIDYAAHGYNGLKIELKRKGTKIYKRDGSPATEHIAGQMQFLKNLNSLGYLAVMAVGYDEALSIADTYLKGYSQPQPQGNFLSVEEAIREICQRQQKHITLKTTSVEA